MRELRQRAEPILKIICLILAALVVYQLAEVFIRWNPFRGVTVPALPTLAAATNNPASSRRGTNLAASTVKVTNAPPHLATTLATTNSAAGNTNSVGMTNLATAGTNALTPAMETAKTNIETNVVARRETKSSGTNPPQSTNAAGKATNALLSATAGGTNAAAVPKLKNSKAGPAPQVAGMNSNRFQPPGSGTADLSPAMKSRISRITESEILGPVMHPLPMALLGIAGDVAFLRSDHGQTGLVKAGDSLDDLKLLRIGINRVLIEQNGEKKELMIFNGYGGESLLPKDSTNENKHL